MAVNNQLPVSQVIADLAVPMFDNEIVYMKTGNYDLAKVWEKKEYQYGDTVQFLREMRGITVDGQVAQFQAIVDRPLSLTINHQFHQDMQYSVPQATLFMKRAPEQFLRHYVKPRVAGIVATFEQQVVMQAITDLWFFTGTPGTPINSYLAQDQAAQMLESIGIPGDELYLGLSLQNYGFLRASQANQFNQMINKEVNERAALGHLGSFDIFKNQANNLVFQSNLANGTTGTITASVPSGATSISIDFGLANAGKVIQPGDRFNIGVPSNPSSTSNVYIVNMLTQATTPYLACCVVQNTVTLDGTGTGTFNILPDLTWNVLDADGNPNSVRDINVQPLVGFTVTLVGSYTVNLAYHRNALNIAAPPLARLPVVEWGQSTAPKAPISLTLSAQGDVTNYQTLWRMDTLAAVKWNGDLGLVFIS